MPSFNREQTHALDRLWLAKLIVRAVVALLSIIAIGCFGWILSRHQGYYGSISTIFEYFGFIPLGISLIWFLISTVYLVVRSRPVHPSWHLGIDLFLFLVYIVFNIFVGVAAISDYSYYGFDGYDSSGYETEVSDAETSLINRLIRVQMTGWIILLLLLLIHFALFVWACVDTSRLRRSRAAKQMADEMIAGMRARGELAPAQEPFLETVSAFRSPNATPSPYYDAPSTSRTVSEQRLQQMQQTQYTHEMQQPQHSQRNQRQGLVPPAELQ